MFSADIKGINEFLRKLKYLPTKITKEVDAEIGLGVEAMATVAKRLAPGDQGLLRSEISASKRENMVWEFVSQAGYAGYIEFGTRSKVRIPAGAEEIAAEVRANKFKSSLTAKQAIYAWCKRKSIDPKLWFPIYISIMVNGIEPHPYFFPAFEQEFPKLLKNVKNVVENII